MRRVLGVALALGAMLLLPPSARAQTTAVDIQDSAYVPAQVTIEIGDDVTWTVSGDGYHTVTFDDGTHSSQGCIALTGTNCMSHGAQFIVTFNTAGLYSYHCEVHPEMTGTVFVESGASRSTSTSTSSSTTTTSNPAASSTSSSSDSTASSLSQAPPPTFTSTTRVALPKSVTVRAKSKDDVTPWVLADVAIAGTTAITGAVLVRKRRVPFG